MNYPLSSISDYCKVIDIENINQRNDFLMEGMESRGKEKMFQKLAVTKSDSQVTYVTQIYLS